MPGHEQEAKLGKVLSLLQEWDRGDKTVRSRILTTFVAENTGKTFYELELVFAQVASLFLARITTWMRLTYKFGTSLALQLKAIQIFLFASSHDQYITEFLEDGGVLTLLDILNQAKEEHKAEVLCVLLLVSKAGRSYKEFICESNGVKAIAECLSISKSEETQEKAWAVLDSLSHGNPKFQNHVYKALIALLTYTSSKGQKLVLSSLHSLQSKMKTAHHRIVNPLLETLKTLHLEVQGEAVKLILELRHFEVRSVLLNGLVALLRPAKEELEDSHNKSTISEMERIRTTGTLPVFVQQAAAAKIIRILAEDSKKTSHELLSLQVVEHLLTAIGNREHSESQIQASLALKHFVDYPIVQEPVQRIMGDTLFSAFMSNPGTVYTILDETQTETFLSNSAGLNLMTG